MDCKPLPMLPYALIIRDASTKRPDPQLSPALKQPANFPGSVPQKRPAPPLIFNHNAKKSLGDPLK